MPTITAATISAPQMKRDVENHQAAVKIKIAGQNFRRRDAVFGAMKFHHADAADAGFIPRFRRNLGDQFFGNFNFSAPARAFVNGNGAKLAIIRLAAERTVFRLANCLD